ncbi:MAG: type II toxin-antitoxin system VapB family antitoxin [Sphingomonadales bacterium]|nr:type II toxin-antitoxin system VapB family antitoxin [Sphingomonadales bacterium]
MSVQINIKNQKTRALLDEIVQRTGESVTEAVTAALEKRLRELTRDEKLARVRELTKGIADRLVEPWKSMDHGEMLYDENGLPK